jgi:hypothetical protein
MYDYYHKINEARERGRLREREAEAERTWREARGRRQRRRAARLANALGQLVHARKEARLRAEA